MCSCVFWCEFIDLVVSNFCNTHFLVIRELGTPVLFLSPSVAYYKLQMTRDFGNPRGFSVSPCHIVLSRTISISLTGFMLFRYVPTVISDTMI